VRIKDDVKSPYSARESALSIAMSCSSSSSLTILKSVAGRSSWMRPMASETQDTRWVSDSLGPLSLLEVNSNQSGPHTRRIDLQALDMDTLGGGNELHGVRLAFSCRALYFSILSS
jgi:hypothetical protein